MIACGVRNKLKPLPRATLDDSRRAVKDIQVTCYPYPLDTRQASGVNMTAEGKDLPQTVVGVSAKNWIHVNLTTDHSRPDDMQVRLRSASDGAIGLPRWVLHGAQALP